MLPSFSLSAPVNSSWMSRYGLPKYSRSLNPATKYGYRDHSVTINPRTNRLSLPSPVWANSTRFWSGISTFPESVPKTLSRAATRPFIIDSPGATTMKESSTSFNMQSILDSLGVSHVKGDER